MIITLAKVKTLLQITASTYDTYINALIPLVESVISQYANDDFLDVVKISNSFVPNVYLYSRTISFVNSTNSINDTANLLNTYNFAVGDSIRPYYTLHNNQSFTIKSIAAASIVLESIDTINNESAGTDILICKLKFPTYLELVASEMIGYKLSKKDMTIKSKKIDDYSYTNYDKFINGFPESIFQSVPRSLYRRGLPMNWGVEIGY
jgi:hypothetical protein